MARGKYANRAARRREDESVRAEIGDYQHRVKQLTEENRELRERLDTETRALRAEVRSLKAQRDEGAAPEVFSLRREVEKQRDRADAAAARRREIQKTWDRAASRMVARLCQVHGYTGREALGDLAHMCREDDDDREPPRLMSPDAPMSTQRRIGGEGIERVEAARARKGTRPVNSPDVDWSS